MIVENDENDDEPDIEELGSALHGCAARSAPWLPRYCRRGRAVLLLGRAERVFQVVRRASKREKLDTPGHYIHASAVGVMIGGLVLAEDGRSIQAIHLGLDADAPAAGRHWNATSEIRADDQRVPGHARVSRRHAPAGRVVGADTDVLVDVEAAPGDRVDDVDGGLSRDIPVRRPSSCPFLFTCWTAAETTLARHRSKLLGGRVGPEVPTADDTFVGQDQRSITPRGEFHVLVLVTERLAENIEQDQGGEK